MKKLTSIILLFTIVITLSACDSLTMKDPVVSFCTENPDDIMCDEEQLTKEQMIQRLIANFVENINVEDKGIFCYTYIDAGNASLIDDCIESTTNFLPSDYEDLDPFFELKETKPDGTVIIQVNYKDGENGYLFELKTADMYGTILLESVTYSIIMTNNPFTALDFTDVFEEYFLDIYDLTFTTASLIDIYFQDGYINNLVYDDLIYLRNWSKHTELLNIEYIQYFDGYHVLGIDFATHYYASDAREPDVYFIITAVKIVDGEMKIQPFIGEMPHTTFLPSEAKGIDLIESVLREHYDGTLNCFKRFSDLNGYLLVDEFPEDACDSYLSDFIPNGDIISLDLDAVTDRGFLLTTVYTDRDTDQVITRINYITFEMGMYGLSIGTFQTYEWYQTFIEN